MKNCEDTSVVGRLGVDRIDPRFPYKCAGIATWQPMDGVEDGGPSRPLWLPLCLAEQDHQLHPPHPPPAPPPPPPRPLWLPL